jgi:hypothetical protein
MPTLTLPQLVAGRELAAAAVERLGPIDGADVTIDARPLVSGTASFAAELVRSTIVTGHAARLVVAGGPPDFVADLRAAARQLAVAGRVVLATEVPAAS